MRLIGISGKFMSGKDTLAEILSKQYEKIGKKTKILKFADSLKQICSILGGTDLEDQYTQDGKMKMNAANMTNGRLQQIVGTTLREHVNENIWIFPVIEYYKKNPDTVCIISDCRFKNEAEEIRKNGGILIRINREISNDSFGRDRNHISETDLDDYPFDVVIENNRTVEDLNKIISQFIQLF
jgi:hypothetical protein